MISSSIKEEKPTVFPKVFGLLEQGRETGAGERFMCQRNSACWPGARDFSCGFPVSARRLAGAGRAFNSNQVPPKGKHSKRRTWSLSLKNKESIRMSAITHISVIYPPWHAAPCSQPPAQPPRLMETETTSEAGGRKAKSNASEEPQGMGWPKSKSQDGRCQHHPMPSKPSTFTAANQLLPKSNVCQAVL